MSSHCLSDLTALRRTLLATLVAFAAMAGFDGARGLSRAPDHADRLLSGRRRHRYRGAPDQHPARRSARQAGDRREPRRRRRQYRHRRGRARGARWLHAARLFERLRGQSEPLCASVPTIRSRISPRSWCSAPRPTCSWFPGAVRDQVHARADRQGEGEPGQAQLDEPGRRHDAASRRRTPQAANRHRHGAHPVHRRWARR